MSMCPAPGMATTSGIAGSRPRATRPAPSTSCSSPLAAVVPGLSVAERDLPVDLVLVAACPFLIPSVGTLMAIEVVLGAVQRRASPLDPLAGLTGRLLGMGHRLLSLVDGMSDGCPLRRRVTRRAPATLSLGDGIFPLVQACLSLVLGALAHVGDALPLIGRLLPRVCGPFPRVGPCFPLVGQPAAGGR